MTASSANPTTVNEEEDDCIKVRYLRVRPKKSRPVECQEQLTSKETAKDRGGLAPPRCAGELTSTLKPVTMIPRRRATTNLFSLRLAEL